MSTAGVATATQTPAVGNPVRSGAVGFAREAVSAKIAGNPETVRAAFQTEADELAVNR